MLPPPKLAALRRYIGLSKTGSNAHIQAVRKFLEGDHWQDGLGWVGPSLPSDDPNAAAVMAKIRRDFVSKNLVREAVIRHRDAVLGDEANWGFSPVRTALSDGPPPEQELIDEAEAALTQWWDRQRVWQEIQAAFFDAIGTGKGVLRLFIPKAATLIDEEGRSYVPQGTLEEVLAAIRLKRADRDAAGIARDEDGEPVATWFDFRDSRGYTKSEIQFLDEQGNTVVLIEGKRDEFAASIYPLDGNFLIYEIDLEPLITPQAVSQQKLINKALTMLSRNVDTGGFVERTILNGQMPGEWKEDANGRKIWQPAPFEVGPGVTNFIRGVSYEDADGNKRFAPVDIRYRDPVSVETFRDTRLEATAAFYDEVRQTFMMISGDTTASGKSRIQATQDFLSSLEPTARALEAALRWLFTTVLRWAAFFMDNARPDRYDPVRPVIHPVIRAVQMTPEEITADLQLRDGGVISTETLMRRSGRVQDPDAERARIAQEMRERWVYADPFERVAALAAALSAGLYSKREALLLDGNTPEEAARIIQEQLEESQARLPMP